ncbi:DUF3857 domain-containing protein [Pseudoduganella sp. GCM10020061]|uniref:DUF3857 domain-containing protein n=1 Tax=Pseudoduganella sp. GCM10020061 TaxID=3317345 RepID=UPI0036295AD4
MPHWAQPLAEAPETSRKDAVVVRLAETQAYIGKKYAYLVNQVVQANDRSALSEIGQFSVDYYPAYQRLLLHRVAIIRNGSVSDRTASASLRLLDQESEANQGVYGGATTMRLLLDDVQRGDALWVTYTKEGRNPVFGNKFTDRFSIQRSTPIELRRLTLLQEEGRAIDWIQVSDFKLQSIDPSVDTVGSLKRTRFEARNLDAVPSEPSIPANYFPAQFLHATEYKDWNEVARWASALFPAVPASPALDGLVRQFARESGDAAKAAAALQWVQDEIRYFSVSIGENSHRPQPPDLVVKRRYGDCKDKAYLLVTLLKRLGIKAEPVLVNVSGPRVPARLLPSTLWFDHAVVRVTLGDKTWLIDPTRTGEKGAIAQRPAVLPGGVGLVAAPDSKALLEIADVVPEEPGFERIEKLVLPSLDGPAQLEVRTIYRGRMASQARRVFPSLSENELEKEALSGHEKQYSGLALAGNPQLIDSDDGATYELQSRFTLKSPVEMRENVPFVTFRTKVLESTLQIPDKLVRNFPFALPYGRYYGRYRMEVIWPELTRSAPKPPVAAIVDTPYFSARDEISFRGRTLSYSLEYRVKSDDVPAASLPDLQSKVPLLNEFDPVTLRRQETTVIEEPARNVLFRDLETGRWGSLMDELARDKAAREDAGSDFYCNVATSAYAVSINSPGKSMSRKSLIGSLPTDGIVAESRCDAVAAFKTGDFKDAARRFAAGGNLPNDHMFLPRQAWSLLHAGDRSGALANMERFVHARIREGKLNSLEIADALALYQRAGVPFPSFLLEQVPGDLEQWPRPVIAMQLGKMTPAELIGRAEVLDRDERIAALNDAWLYVAQWHFARGDKAAGLEALRWYPVNGLLGSDRHAHAFAELWHLEQSDADLQAGLELWNAGKHGDAIAFFRKAAQRQQPYGQYWLGVAYYSGKGVAKDLGEARQWLEKAASAGVEHAMNDLGYMAMNGDYGPKDEKLALEWLSKAARHGQYHASHVLGVAYAYGKLGVAQDKQRSFHHFWQAAQLGNPESQAALAAIYRLGNGQPRDPGLAHVWAKRSADNGNPSGMVELGILLWNGAGVAKDEKAALDLLRKASDMGSREAQQFIADTYIGATDGKRDIDQAREWYLKAAQNGSVHAKYMLALLSTGELGGKADHAKALEWYKAAADAGYLPAINNLADMYERGAGAPQDLEKAVAGYRQAATGGLGMAMYSLATLYERGLGLPRDKLMAYTYYGLAIQRKVDDKRIDIARKKQAELIAEATPAQKTQADKLIAQWKENDPLPGVPAGLPGAGGTIETVRK